MNIITDNFCRYYNYIHRFEVQTKWFICNRKATTNYGCVKISIRNENYWTTVENI